MTTRYKARAFIFKKNDVNESDRFFSVFTDEFGRLDIFAKAIRKNASKLRSGMDIFFMSEIEFIQGRNRKTLTDAVATKKFNSISQNIEKFKIANRIGEILDNFIKGQEKDEEIFNLLDETFIKLNNYQLSIINYQLLYYYFLWNFFSIQGYRSEVQKCVICYEKLNPCDIYFSSKEGGVICGNCAQTKKTCPEPCRRINSDVVKILRIILSKDWQILSKLKVEPSSQKILSEISENAINSFCQL
jgi:DNA repair protein RecO (recombination protein O)